MLQGSKGLLVLLKMLLLLTQVSDTIAQSTHTHTHTQYSLISLSELGILLATAFKCEV
jgi:hypothetical protein